MVVARLVETDSQSVRRRSRIISSLPDLLDRVAFGLLVRGAGLVGDAVERELEGSAFRQGERVTQA